jgi:transcriptional repressor of dcmA and dcmR
VKDSKTDDWLSTSETAEFLRVSEASVRRLSDRGVLPAHRVGRRRVRRYRVEDVRQFARRERALEPAPGLPVSQVLVGGLPVEISSHLAPMYDSDAGRLRLSLPFLVDGIRAAQPCFLIAHATGILSLADAPGSTLAEALEFWEERAWAAVTSGASVLRLVGEMASVRERFISEKEMLAFEAAVNLTFRRFPIVGLCQYDARAFSGVALISALRSHPDLFEFPLGRFLS